MSFLLDTCSVSERLKKKPNPGLVKWLNSQDPFDLHLCVISVGELEKGIGLLPNSAKRSRLRNWLNEDLIPFFGYRLLDFGLEESRAWGRIFSEQQKSGAKPPVIDSMIAAIASVHGLNLVTRNVDDFKHMPIDVFNPWSY